MHYPDFFNTVPEITLQDSLSAFLGTFEQGKVTFSYLDVVKSAGHSCPTVAGAYLCALEGLNALYENELPQRGAIEVRFKEGVSDGVAGVIGSVIANITGATTNYGFKGINGKFDRRSLMFYDADIDASVVFTRLDTKKSVAVTYNPQSVPGNPQQNVLMQKIMQGKASDEDKKMFGVLWQERVAKILAHVKDVITVSDIS